MREAARRNTRVRHYQRYIIYGVTRLPPLELLAGRSASEAVSDLRSRVARLTDLTLGYLGHKKIETIFPDFIYIQQRGHIALH